MSNDLISRKQLKKAIHVYVEQHRNDDEVTWTGFDWLLKEDAVIDIINSQPTAYDVDRVVEQLEKMRDTSMQNITLNLQSYDIENEIESEGKFYAKIIEIVKAGGADE